MWQLYMMCNAIIIIDLVVGEVHSWVTRLPTGVAGRNAKEMWDNNTVHVLQE